LANAWVHGMPGGVSLEELTTIVRLAIASSRTVGRDVTIFNPKLDRNGSIATAFVDVLIGALCS
jgi:arginase